MGFRFLRQWLSQWTGPSVRSAGRMRCRPGAETLEDRTLLATYFVNTTLDSGAGSLRQALLEANTNPGLDRIEFNINGGGPAIISPASALPTISSPVVLDGTTQPTYAGVPLIQLDGGSGGSFAHGILLNSAGAGSTIKGLMITRFGGDGIRASTSNLTVLGCYIGTNASGVNLGNGGQGVNNAFGGDNITVGGVGPFEGNVISGNGGYGFSLGGSGHRVLGNIVGLTPDGTTALPNNGAGGNIDGDNITIGGTDPAARNVISGNNGPGFYLRGSNHVVQGNFIGTNALGTAAVPNTSDGIHFASGVGGVLIGGTAAGARNVISGNGGSGLAIYISSNRVEGNYIGVGADGVTRLGNNVGVYIGRHGVVGNVIGGSDPAARNIISGNRGDGISLTTGPIETRVEGNYIGTDAMGTTAAPNATGIGIDGASNTIVGNVIAGNTGRGIFLSGPANVIQGNRIGITGSGSALGNGSNGIYAEEGNSTIGGITPGAGNIIAFNGSQGVWVNSEIGHAIRGNSIYSNNGLGIDLNPNGVTANDAGDADAGANNKQNFPVLIEANSFSGNTVIRGAFNSTASATFALDFYASENFDPQLHGEGQQYIGSTTVVTDAAGNASFTATLPIAATVGWKLTATATDAAGSTSEFSRFVNIFGAPQPPTIDDIPDQAAFEDFAVGPLQFQALDLETPGSVTITAVSSNQTLVPDANIVLQSFAGAPIYSITVTPAANQFGTVTITVTISDGVLSTSDTFLINFQPVNDPPVLAVNNGLTIAEGGTLVVNSSRLLATDLDNTPAELTFRLTILPSHGTLQRDLIALGLGSTFTQQDVFEGRIRYVHDGSETLTDRFAFDLSDGTLFALSLASGGLGGTPASSISDQAALSGNGRYVAFRSQANNLVEGDTNNRGDIFLYDVYTGLTQRVSVASDEAEGDGESGSTFYRSPGLSGDGRFVAFASTAANLIAGDSNGAQDVFVRDTLLGATTRVSVSTAGAQANNGSASYGVAISADARYVGFSSFASNLAANDLNGAEDVILRDRVANQTTSISSAGGTANARSDLVSISADGRYVAFRSLASNLVAGDTNNRYDIFVRDRQTNATTRVSVDSLGNQANADSTWPSISADGRYVAFESTASNLVPGDTNNRVDVFVHDRLTGQTTRLTAPNGVQTNFGAQTPSISADGRFVAFSSSSTNLVPGDTTIDDIYICDRLTGQMRRMSVSSTGVPGNNLSLYPSISADGMSVAFESSASNLHPNAGINKHIFVASSGVVPGLVAITITPVNDQPPTISDIANQTIDENTSTGPIAFTVGDPDTVPAALTVTAQSSNLGLVPLAGIVLEGADASRTVTITPAANMIGTAMITLTVSDGQFTAIDTFVVTVVRPPLRVSSFTKTSSGFTVVFNRPIATTDLNLYSSQASSLGAADVVVRDAGGSSVRGSMVIGTANDRITFIQTGDALTAGDYTVTLRSAANGFRDTQGSLLDGDLDGSPGGDYTTTFTIDPPSAVIVGVADFARGPGQDVVLPTSALGLPLRLSSSEGVTSVVALLTYNPNILEITGVAVDPARTPGATASLLGGGGGVRIEFTSPALPSGISDFVWLTARVLDAATGAYARKQILDLTSVTVNDAPALDDDGLHVVAYAGDASGNGTLSSMDAALALRVAIGLDGGLDAYQQADPRILADVNGNGRVDSTDATWILQKAVGLPRPEIPDRPSGIVIPPTSGPDPFLFLPKTFAGRPGDTIVVPVNLDRSEGLQSVDLALAYDSSRLELLAENGLARGTLTGDFDLMLFNHDPAAGTIRVGLSRSAGPIDDHGFGSVLLLTFRIRANAPAGRAIINLRESLDGTATALNEGGLDLVPDPRDRAGDILDGAVTVLPRPRRRPGEIVRDRVFAAVREPAFRPPADLIVELLRGLTPAKRTGSSASVRAE